MKVKIKKTRLNQIIQEEYTRHNIKKLRENRNELDDYERPASRREHLGDAITDVLTNALIGYLREFNIPSKVMNNIVYDTEEALLDVAIKVSQAVGATKGFAHDEMDESGNSLTRGMGSAADHFEEDELPSDKEFEQQIQREREQRAKGKDSYTKGMGSAADHYEDDLFDNDALADAIAEVLSEEGLGDGQQLGGNYSTGTGGSSGPDQTIVPSK